MAAFKAFHPEDNGSPAQQYPGSFNNNSTGTPASPQTHSERTSMGRGGREKEVKGWKKMEKSRG